MTTTRRGTAGARETRRPPPPARRGRRRLCATWTVPQWPHVRAVLGGVARARIGRGGGDDPAHRAVLPRSRAFPGTPPRARRVTRWSLNGRTYVPRWAGDRARYGDAEGRARRRETWRPLPRAPPRNVGGAPTTVRTCHVGPCRCPNGDAAERPTRVRRGAHRRAPVPPASRPGGGVPTALCTWPVARYGDAERDRPARRRRAPPRARSVLLGARLRASAVAPTALCTWAGWPERRRAAGQARPFERRPAPSRARSVLFGRASARPSRPDAPAYVPCWAGARGRKPG